MTQPDRIDVAVPLAASPTGLLAGLWGVAGFVLIVVRALVAMTAGINATLMTPLSGLQLLTYAASTILFGVVKGYFVFHQRFCPRYVSRIGELCRSRPGVLPAVLAPLYCFSLLGAEPRRLAQGYALIGAISLMIVSTKLLPFPWRGMILTGVAAALAWSVLEVGYQGLREVILAGRHADRG